MIDYPLMNFINKRFIIKIIKFINKKIINKRCII